MDPDAVNAAMGSRSDWKRLQNELKAKGAVTSGAIRLLMEQKRQESEGTVTSLTDLEDDLESEESAPPVRRGSIVAVQLSNLVENASFMLKDALEYSKVSRPDDDELIVGFDLTKRSERRRRSVGAVTAPPNHRKDISCSNNLSTSVHSKGGERRNSTSTTSSTVASSVSSSTSSLQQRRGSSFAMSNNLSPNNSFSESTLRRLSSRGSANDLVNLADFKHNNRDMKNAQFTTNNNNGNGFATRTSTMARLFGVHRDDDGNGGGSGNLLNPNDIGISMTSPPLRGNRGLCRSGSIGKNITHGVQTGSRSSYSRRSSLADLVTSHSMHSYLLRDSNINNTNLQQRRPKQPRRSSSATEDWGHAGSSHSHANSGCGPRCGDRAQRAIQLLFGGRKEGGGGEADNNNNDHQHIGDYDDDDDGSLGEFADEEYYARLRD